MYITKEQTRKVMICALAGFSAGMPFYFFNNLIFLWLRSDRSVTGFIDLFFSLRWGPSVALIQHDLLYAHVNLFAFSPYMITSPIDLKIIGLFSLLQLPYILKFLWAPVLDRYAPLYLGRRRGWILITQIALMLIMMSYAWLHPSTQMYYVIILSSLLIFFSATQDIAIHALRREILTDRELGLGTSITITTYRLAVLVPGSLALILSDMISWSYVFIITAFFMVVGMCVVLISPEPAMQISPPQNFRAMMAAPIAEYWNRKGARNFYFIIAFFVLYKLGDTLMVSLSNVFYYDIGYSRTVIGSIAKYAQVSAAIVGGLLGGILMIRININKALWWFGAVQMTSILGCVWLSSFGLLAEIGIAEKVYLAIVVAYEYFGVGLGAVALIALMARESNPMYAATQIALFSAIAGIPRVLFSSVSGWLIDIYGYHIFFWICFLLATPGMLILFKVAPYHGIQKIDLQT